MSAWVIKLVCCSIIVIMMFHRASTITASSKMYADEPLLYDTFPSDFKWAAATSAYQIEGGWDADGKGLSIWDVFSSNTSVISDGSNGQRACNSYNFYEKDIELLKSLNVTYYRFSISWTRILPNGIGEVNQAGINYYRNLIIALKAARIEPMVTLYHWDLPQALEEKGGWLNANISEWFVEYASICFSEFGRDVKYWITINEPWVIAYQGYGIGIYAPGKIGPGTFTYEAGHNLILAHAKAYRLYQDSFQSTQQGKVGITLNIDWHEPLDSTVANIEAAERGLQFMGGWFANPIFGTGDYPSIMKLKIAEKSQQQNFSQSRLPEFTEEEKLIIQGSSDFFGLNHYTSVLTENKMSPIDNIDYEADKDVYTSFDPSWYGSSSSWLKVAPFGMRSLLTWIKDTYGNPEILITENGFSDKAGNLDDFQRIYYYKHYINNVLKAIRNNGVRVTGYAAWSLMDNFEWSSGYTQKFGIFAVDFNSNELTRTAKASARYYAQIIRDNGFNIDQPCNNYPI